ncbi:MAG: hypothetical protein RLO11_05935 [Salinisphaeraceae bacterium]
MDMKRLLSAGAASLFVVSGALAQGGFEDPSPGDSSWVHEHPDYERNTNRQMGTADGRTSTMYRVNPLPIDVLTRSSSASPRVALRQNVGSNIFGLEEKSTVVSDAFVNNSRIPFAVQEIIGDDQQRTGRVIGYFAPDNRWVVIENSIAAFEAKYGFNRIDLTEYEADRRLISSSVGEFGSPNGSGPFQPAAIDFELIGASRDAGGDAELVSISMSGPGQVSFSCSNTADGNGGFAPTIEQVRRDGWLYTVSVCKSDAGTGDPHAPHFAVFFKIQDGSNDIPREEIAFSYAVLPFVDSRPFQGVAGSELGFPGAFAKAEVVDCSLERRERRTLFGTTLRDEAVRIETAPGTAIQYTGLHVYNDMAGQEFSWQPFSMTTRNLADGGPTRFHTPPLQVIPSTDITWLATGGGLLGLFGTDEPVDCVARATATDDQQADLTEMAPWMPFMSLAYTRSPAMVRDVGADAASIGPQVQYASRVSGGQDGTPFGVAGFQADRFGVENFPDVAGPRVYMNAARTVFVTADDSGVPTVVPMNNMLRAVELPGKWTLPPGGNAATPVIYTGLYYVGD